MKVKKFFRASRGRIAATHTAFASGRTTQKMLPTGLGSTGGFIQLGFSTQVLFQEYTFLYDVVGPELSHIQLCIGWVTAKITVQDNDI